MTTPATRHPWLWNTKDIRKALNAYREGKGYGGVITGDPEAMADDIDDLKEAAAPRTLEGDGSDLPFDSVVIDCDGDAWQRDWVDGWSLAGESSENTPVLSPEFAPYTIVHTPEKES